MRDWTDRAGMSLFYFEAFDEQWKDSGDAWGSENHFGLIRLNNEVKYALWDILDQGGFDGLTRDGRPLVKSYGGDEAKLLADVLNPPFKSRMAIRKTTTVNPAAVPGEAVTADRYIVVHESMQPSDSNNMTYPSAVLKLIPWEGTVSIEMSQQGVVSITTRTSDWWGTSLEFQAEVGENLENFKSGYLHFEIRGDADVSFNIGSEKGKPKHTNHGANEGIAKIEPLEKTMELHESKSLEAVLISFIVIPVSCGVVPFRRLPSG